MKKNRQKLSLRTDELRVESFPTGPVALAGRATVHGHQRPTFAATCPQSCQAQCGPPTEDPQFCAIPTTTLPSAQVDFETNCV